MPIEKGKVFLLKIGDGEAVEAFTTVGKLRSTSSSGSRETIGVTNKDSGTWEERLPGFKSFSVSGSGVWDGSASQLALRDAYLDEDDTPVNFQIIGASDTTEGPFVVTQFDNDGEYNGERTYSVTLESAGAMEVTDA